MTNNHKEIIIRFILLFSLVFTAFIVVLVQIVYLQTAEKDEWLALAEKHQTPAIHEMAAIRGNIYDCHGKLLTGSLPTYQLFMDMRVPALHQGGDTLFLNNVDEVSRELARITGERSASEYRAYLMDGFKRKQGELRLSKSPLNYTQMKQVYQIPLYKKYSKFQSGLILRERHERVKPYGSLASRTLGGIYGNDGAAHSGLELKFDSYLRGTPGRGQRARVNGKMEEMTLEEPVHGMDVVTTIDANLQDMVETVLRQQVTERGADWGCCLLMETSSGEVKAIANLDRNEDGTYSEKKNHAVTRVEPGSTFKTISLMAAMDDGKIAITDTFRTYSGGWKYYDATHRDAHRMDTVLNMHDALAVSSNIIFAKMVTSAYEKKGQKFVDKLKRMHIADSIPCEIPGAQRPLLQAFNDYTTLSKMSYGYSVELTPWQIMMFYNAIANNGRMITPYLVKSVERDGETVVRYSPETLTSSICSSSVLRDIKQALHAVVWEELGTASARPWSRKAQSAQVSIAGKTGTAQMQIGGRYSGEHHRIFFVGYFPEENPQYTCIFIMEDPKKPYDAGINCGSSVRIIAERTMAYAHTQQVSALAYDSILKPTIKGGMQEHIRRAAKGSGLHVSKTDSQWARVNQEMQAVDVEVVPDRVPNVIGMGARDAVYAIEQTGMRVRLTGKGKVYSQSVAGGSKITPNGTIYLELK